MLAIGLMSGTSLDGIDAALIETDGERVTARMGGITAEYDERFRVRLRACLGARTADEETRAVERELTERHADAVRRLLDRVAVDPGAVSLVGFHGHTLTHDPANRFTWQIGDGGLLARLAGIDTVSDFRSADVAAGGEGAPFAPAYHRALAEPLDKPVAVLNLGGVANVTFIGSGNGSGIDSGAASVGGPEALIAFDTGPANALIDDWVSAHTGRLYDDDGAFAAAGTVDETALATLLDHPYFGRLPPKSLDRNEFDRSAVDGLSVADGAATLAAFTVEAVARAARHLPMPPIRWLVTGGGRRNVHLMRLLKRTLGVPVDPVEAVGWDGDFLEAEAFALLATRSARGLALSWPATTGVGKPMTGGRLHSVGA